MFREDFPRAQTCSAIRFWLFSYSASPDLRELPNAGFGTISRAMPQCLTHWRAMTNDRTGGGLCASDEIWEESWRVDCTQLSFCRWCWDIHNTLFPRVIVRGNLLPCTRINHAWKACHIQYSTRKIRNLNFGKASGLSRMFSKAYLWDDIDEPDLIG